MATAATPKFRIDVTIHDLLMRSNPNPPAPPAPKGATLPEAVFPQHPELLDDPGPETPPERRPYRLQCLRHEDPRAARRSSRLITVAPGTAVAKLLFPLAAGPTIITSRA